MGGRAAARVPATTVDCKAHGWLVSDKRIASASVQCEHAPRWGKTIAQANIRRSGMVGTPVPECTQRSRNRAVGANESVDGNATLLVGVASGPVPRVARVGAFDVLVALERFVRDAIGRDGEEGAGRLQESRFGDDCGRKHLVLGAWGVADHAPLVASIVARIAAVVGEEPCVLQGREGRRRGRWHARRRRGRCRRWRTALHTHRAPDARGGANAAAERLPSVRAATRGRDGLSFELVHPPGGLVVDHSDRLRCPPLREAATAAALDVEIDRVDRFGRLPVEERVVDHVGVGEARAAVGQTAGERLRACVVNVPRIEPRVDESANVDG